MSYPWTTAQTTAVATLGLYNPNRYDAATNPYGFGVGGHRQNHTPALNNEFVAAGAVKDAADYAGAKADAAAASATAAAASADRLAGTSATSVTIGTGLKSFTTASGKAFEAGRVVRAASAADPTGSYMVGRVSSYTGTALTLAVLFAVGSGARADWRLYTEGEPGSAGTVAVGAVTLLSADKAPTVSNSGTAAAAILDFGIPAGRPSGLIYKWSTANTATDPTSGRLKASSSSLTGATALYVSEVDLAGIGQSATLASWDDSSNPVRGQIRIEDIANPANFVLFAVNGDLVDNGPWDTLPVAYIDKGGTLTDGATVRLDFARTGDKGGTGAPGTNGVSPTVTVGTVNTGSAGTQASVTNAGTATAASFNFVIPRGDQGIPGPAVAIQYAFSTVMTDADPGNGNLRFNNGTLSAVTQLFVDNVEALAGTSMTAWLDGFGASTNPSGKGTLTLKSLADPTKQVVFRVTGSIVDGTGYRKVPVAFVAGNGGFTDGGALGVAFDRAGDKGTDGGGAGDVIGPSNATDGGLALFNGTSGKAIQSGAKPGALATKDSVNNTNWSGTALALSNGGTGATDAVGARTALGLVPGTDVQAYSAKLAAYAGQAWATDQAPYFTGAAALGAYTLTALGRSLAGSTDAGAAQTALQLRPGTDIQPYAVTLADVASAVETSIASAATADIGASNTRRVLITGTTAITSLGTSAGRERLLRFADALTLTHNATSLILPTGASIVTAAGDTALATSDASGNWRVRFYQRASGLALVGSSTGGGGAVGLDSFRTLAIRVAKLEGKALGLFDYLVDDFQDTSGYDTVNSLNATLQSGTILNQSAEQYTKSLLHGDGSNGAITTTDAVTGHTVTFGGTASISTEQSVFGGSSFKFSANGDYIGLAASTDFALGTGDFTVNLRVYFNTSAVNRTLLDLRAAGSAVGFYISTTSAGKLYFYDWNTAGVAVGPGTTTLTTGQWYDIEVTRASGTVRVFINGALDSSGTVTSNYGTAAVPYRLGSNYDGSTQFLGYLDEIRLSNVARHTAAFTPATAAFVYGSSGNLDLRSIAVPAQAQPSKASILALIKATAGTINLNSTLTASITRTGAVADATQFTLAKTGTLAGYDVYEGNGLDISGQPAGTSMRYRIQTSDTALGVAVDAVVAQWG